MSQWLKSGVLHMGRAALAGLGLMALSVLPGLAEDVPATATETATPAWPEVIDMRILSNAERARLIIDLNGMSEFATASLAEPDRIVVDVKAKGLEAPIEEKKAGDGLIGAYALKVAEEGRVRATLTLNAPAEVQQAYLLEPVDTQPARLIVDLVPTTPARFAHQVADDYKTAMMRARQQAAASQATADNDADGAGAATEPLALPPAAGPARARPLIVIDPGHGGIDGGAEAPDGIDEKDVVLAFARELQKLLVEQGRFDVAMTRDDDSFLRLEERVALARTNKADLFISIHADKFEDPGIRGTSVYVRDARATDELDKVLAEGENRADLIAGFTPPEVDERVTSILVDLMRRETRRQSYLAAEAVIASLDPTIRMRKIPLHKADFFVLQAPEVPSMLIELGFLSNSDDVANLDREKWRDGTAAAIAKGIAAYFDGMGQN